MKKFLVLIFTATVGFFSCKQGGKSTPETVNTKNSISVKNTRNDKDIYTKYEYADSKGGSLILQNSFPRGGIKYTDPNGEEYYYAVFFTLLINETDNPIELKITFPVDSYEFQSLSDRYFKLLLPGDTMTLDKAPL